MPPRDLDWSNPRVIFDTETEGMRVSWYQVEQSIEHPVTPQEAAHFDTSRFGESLRRQREVSRGRRNTIEDMEGVVMHHGNSRFQRLANPEDFTWEVIPRWKPKRNLKHYFKFPLVRKGDCFYTGDNHKILMLNEELSPLTKDRIASLLCKWEGFRFAAPLRVVHGSICLPDGTPILQDFIWKYLQDRDFKKILFSGREIIKDNFLKWIEERLTGYPKVKKTKIKFNKMKTPPYKTRPPWCNYPGEVERPAWGCWSLLNGNIKCERNCREANGEWCECHNADWRKKREKEKREKEIKTL